jgi:steroid delta-isomerase-like uncharacterized protein
MLIHIEPVAVVHSLIQEIFNNRELDRLSEFVTSDVIDRNRIVLGQPDGSDGVSEGVRLFLTAFPDFHADIEETLCDGERVAACLSMHGTNTGAYRGLPAPTNRHVSWEAVAIFRVRDGKIAEIRGTADRMTMLTQLGILPDLG